MDEFEFKVKLIKTKRKKSATIVIKNDIVSISAPKTLKDDQIYEILKKRKSWIEKKLKEENEKTKTIKLNYSDGEIINYLGKKYIFKINKGDEESVKLSSGKLVATVPIINDNNKDTLESLVKNWYQIQAKRWLTKKTNKFSNLIGVNPVSISVKNYKSRWGSCSNNGKIFYNWKIILAPHNIIDYVVIHELCHLIEFNHSPLYWKYVSNYSSDFKDCKNWLKENNNILNRI